MPFKKDHYYVNTNPATSTYIKVVAVVDKTESATDLLVQFLTKSNSTLIALDEIHIKANDYDRWTLMKSTTEKKL